MLEMDLYVIILDGLVDVLKMHGVTDVEIPNTFTHSVVERCLKHLQKTSSNSELCKLVSMYDADTGHDEKFINYWQNNLRRFRLMCKGN